MMTASSLRDERSADIRDLGVGIGWYGSPCNCRCRHCSLESGKRADTVPFERAEALAEKFVRWLEAQGIEDFPVDIIFGYSPDSPEFVQCTEFNLKHGATGRFVPVNGMRFKTDEELKDLFLSFREIGVTGVGVTFYGLRDLHDRWAGREGDFDYTLQVAEKAAECGIERSESILLSREALPDLRALIDLLDPTPGRKGRHICPWDYRGRGKNLENERITASEISGLPGRVKEFINLDGWRSYKPEGEWVETIGSGEFRRKTSRYYIVSVWQDNIEHLESADCGRVLQEIRETDEGFYQAIPSLSALAELYGRRSGDRIYSLRDLEWKWTDCYAAEHPGVFAAPRGSLGAYCLRK